jgi:para-nitrobenzyl esterase
MEKWWLAPISTYAEICPSEGVFMQKSYLMKIFLTLLIVSNAYPQTDPTVAVTGGTIQGRALAAPGGAVFRGIPFAAPPVGDLRWKETQPVKPWAGTLKTVEYGAPCSQIASGWNDKVAAAAKEDCLFLNVWTSEWPAKGKKQVMFWIHGGANMGGSAMGFAGIEPHFDGERLARHGVVIVTINYRLGVFGFIAHPELTAESPRKASGNYGLMDQIAALNWVRDNIAKFGGDPANVTIFGQSAGGHDTGLLLTSSLARGLFHKAIAESGTVIIGARITPTLAQLEQAGVTMAQKLNAPATGAIKFLRTLSAADILKGSPAYGGGGSNRPEPNIDGHVITKLPAEVFRAGEQAPVPFMLGNNGRERSVQGGAEGLKKAMADFYGPLAEKAAALYGQPPSYAPWGDANAQFATDTQFRCSTVQIANWHSAKFPTWEYEFTRGYEPRGASHSWELQYMFGTLLPSAADPMDRKLSDQMQVYWTNFAKNGNPNGGGLPEWPKLDNNAKAYMELAADGPVVKKGLRVPFCSLFSEKLEQDMAKALGQK